RQLPAEPGAVRTAPPHRPGQFPRREPQQPPAQLLLPAPAPGQRLPGAAAVLPHPPPLSAQRAPRKSRQKPGRITHGAEPSPLAGTARPHAVLPQLIGHASHPTHPPSLEGPLRVRGVTQKQANLNQAADSLAFYPQVGLPESLATRSESATWLRATWRTRTATTPRLPHWEVTCRLAWILRQE